MMDYRLIADKDEYALIQRGNDMQQYAVVNGLDKDKGEWNYTCTYYDAGKYSKLSDEEALFKALDAFRSKTDRDYVPHERLLGLIWMYIKEKRSLTGDIRRQAPAGITEVS